jgi:hypothetical protein
MVAIAVDLALFRIFPHWSLDIHVRYVGWKLLAPILKCFQIL